MSERTSIGETILVCVLIFAGLFLVVHALSRQFFSDDAPQNSSSALIALGSTSSSLTKPADTLLNIPLTPDQPDQTDLPHPQTFSFKGYEFHELANFRAAAVLLSKRTYTGAAGEHRGVLSPCDFAIGWGPMSVPNNLRKFTYFQKNRFFYYASLLSFADQAAALHTDWNVANVHIIPASDNIAAALTLVQPRDIITVEGRLVEIKYREQTIWKSSLSRTDTGDGACELLFLTHLEWRSHVPGTEVIPLPQFPKGEAP